MFNSDNLSLIDLVSEKHAILRKKAESRWRENSDIEFSHTEWFLLSKAEQESLSISQAAHIIDISRQAMQKCAKNLEARGYITLVFIEGNKRDKYITLTKTGKESCKKNNLLKGEIEDEIIRTLGEETVINLKRLLKSSWV
jgi:DNA-binding MarR family transcriptional regulator